LESELFGYEKGAFTGASQMKKGKVELANGGTLFLDEIGDMPMALQAKLLRFLQERVIERVGGVREIPVDVRVICATHRDLTTLIEEGSFREDLYYRVSEITLHVPPLRERAGDALVIAQSLLKTFTKQADRGIVGFGADAVLAIQEDGWPGNVRDLITKVQRAPIMSETRRISAKDLELGEVVQSSAQVLNLRQVRDE